MLISAISHSDPKTRMEPKMTPTNRTRMRLSALAALSATTSVGTVLAGGGAAFATPVAAGDPSLTATMGVYGPQVDGDIRAAIPTPGRCTSIFATRRPRPSGCPASA